MEMFERRLISEWETSGMGKDGCCGCGGEAGLYRQNTLIQLLHQKETRLRRMFNCFAVAAFLLISLALASLIAFGLGVRGLQTAHCQPMKPPENCPSEKPNDMKNPSAMLTAPHGSDANNDAKGYLQWQSELGNAYCHGGFNYSNGALVVPREGIYRVFLQIAFTNMTCRDELTLSYVVFGYSDSYDDNVRFLSSADTVSCSKKPWKKSLYTSGLISLKAKTKLRVKSSHPELIVSNEDLVFFGAELLPQ